MTDYEIRLGNALAAILAAIEQHDSQHVETTDLPEKFKGPMSFPVFEEFIDSGYHFMADPIGHALRKGVRQVGKIMARNGFTSDDAQRVAEYASALSIHNSAYREVICDKHFDGIKFADEEWVA